MRYDNLDIQKTTNGKPYKSLFNVQIDVDKFDYKRLIYSNERLDYLADIYYNDGRYWWVIALFNRIVNPLKTEDIQHILIPTNLVEIVNYILEQSK